MNIKNSIAAVAALGLLAVGYVAGSYIGLPNVDNSMLKGDIGKANAYNQADSEEVLAAVEQLVNDKELQEQMAMAATLLDARIGQMQELADWDDWEDEGWQPDSIYPDIIWEQFDLSAVDKRIKNTRETYDEYTKALAAVVNGEKTEGFEQKANNALLAYTVAEKNVKALAPEMSSALLKVAAQTKSQKAADLASKWIQYSSEDAFINGSKEDMAYWQAKADVIAKSPVLGKMINASVLCCNDLSSLSKSLSAVTPSKTLQMMLGSNSITLLNQDKLNGIVGGGTIGKNADVVGLAFGPSLGLRWW